MLIQKVPCSNPTLVGNATENREIQLENSYLDENEQNLGVPLPKRRKIGNESHENSYI